MHSNLQNDFKINWSIFYLGISIPCFWLWRVYTFIVIDDVPDSEFGIDFCSSFPMCTYNRDVSQSFSIGYYNLLCVAVFLPLLSLFIIAYCKIGHFVLMRKPIDLEPSSLNHQMTRKRRISMALSIMVITFFLCRTPSWIYSMVSV